MSNVKNHFEQPDTGDDNVLNLNGTWKIDGTEVTATAAQLNDVVSSPSSASTITGGQYTMDGDDATAGSATISTGLTTVTSMIVQVVSAVNVVVLSDADVSISGGNIIVADGSLFAVTSGYVVRWIAFGS
jgi:hypothetical protein